MDMHRVAYAAYYQTEPFAFGADPSLSHATRRDLAPRMGQGYASGVGPSVYAYEADLTGLAPGAMYYVVIRATDDSPQHNEEQNQRVLSGVPGS
jgi:hypothetical protein